MVTTICAWWAFAALCAGCFAHQEVAFLKIADSLHIVKKREGKELLFWERASLGRAIMTEDYYFNV